LAIQLGVFVLTDDLPLFTRVAGTENNVVSAVGYAM